MPGANIVIKNTAKGTMTNLNGEYSLKNIKNSNITLVVSFLGYQTKTVNHQFTKQKEKLNISLQPASAQLDEVVVTSRLEGQVKAMHDQKTAGNIKNVISSEQIAQFPDMNAAEAVQRLPGITLQRDQGEGRYVQLRGTPPELTNFDVNGEQIPSPEGDVRYVGMDIISADQIETIEVTKSLTPDMDADGIGGTVNIITKTAEDTIPDINAALAGGYNNLMGSQNYKAQLSFGQRYKKLGFHINGSYYRNNQGSHNMEFKYRKYKFADDTSRFQVVYDDIQLRHYTITRERTGISATLDYRFSPKSSIYLRGMYNNFSDDEVRRRVRYKFGSGFPTSPTSSREAKIARDLKDRIKIQQINTVNFGGKHDIWKSTLDYEISYSLATEKQPDRLETVFDLDLIDLELDLSEENWPRVSFPRDSASVLNYSLYEFDELQLFNGLTTDENMTYKINLTIPYGFSYHNGFVKIGGKIRNKDKERNNQATVYDKYYPIFLPGNRQIYTQEGPELSLETIAGDFEENDLLDRGYETGKFPGPDKFSDFYEFYPQHFKMAESDTKDETYAEDYTAYEDIYAAYFMVKHNFYKFMFIGGVRYEQTDVKYQGFDFQTKKGRWFVGLEPLHSNKEYEFFLPQFQLKYKINDNTNIRTAYTYSYARPNFEDILPYRQEDSQSREVSFGNPSLAFPKSLNLDLLGEKYLPKSGLISGGLFYKRIDDFIFYYKRYAHLDSNFAHSHLMEITMAQNGKKAYVYGAEITSNFMFTFLPGFFKRFGVYLNYTYTYSEAIIQKRKPANSATEVFIYGEDGASFQQFEEGEETIPLPGQAQNSANMALFYDKQPFYFKVSANFHDAFLMELGTDDELDEYYDQAWHMDFTADYRINKNMKVFLEAVNLTNAPLRYYLGTPSRVKQQEYYSWWGRVGFKFSM